LKERFVKQRKLASQRKHADSQQRRRLASQRKRADAQQRKLAWQELRLFAQYVMTPFSNPEMHNRFVN